MTDCDDFKPLTRAQEKLVNASVLIFDDAANEKDAAFMARELVQASLPHKNPGNIQAWTRRNGNITFAMQAGYNVETGESYGYPYGTIPRLLLFWIITEALKTKSRCLNLGSSLTGFMAEIGLNPDNGSVGAKRSDARRLREQMERLFHARISFHKHKQGEQRAGHTWLNMDVAPKGEFWWNPRHPEQGVLWGSSIELGEDFFKAITAAPVPVDMRALQALKKSPLALDLYAWLVYESFRAHKNGAARFETWEQLHSHIGSEYGRLDHFRAKVKDAMVKIRLVYPGLRLGSKQGGIEILPESFPALQPRGGLIIEGAAEPVSVPVPVSASGHTLKATTIERFRARYARLDPYACQAGFDAWLASKPASQQPRYYDKAFLGFAAKWAVGKV